MKSGEQEKKYHYRHTIKISYPTKVIHRLYAMIAPTLFIVLFFILLKVFAFFPTEPSKFLSAWQLDQAALATFIRLLVSYIITLVVGIPLALLANVNAFTERIFFPLFDITQSIPVLVFFPILIVIFVSLHFSSGATITILALSMVWSLTFSLIGGLRVIPQDILAVSKLFHLSWWQELVQITLPSIFPYIVTGSVLAWAQGWNIVIVAEVLHTYAAPGTNVHDVFGLGSIMTSAIQTGNNSLFAGSMIVMVLMIGLINFIVWQRLLSYAERFKFE